MRVPGRRRRRGTGCCEIAGDIQRPEVENNDPDVVLDHIGPFPCTRTMKTKVGELGVIDEAAGALERRRVSELVVVVVLESMVNRRKTRGRKGNLAAAPWGEARLGLQVQTARDL
jgi:hypothetical protein